MEGGSLCKHCGAILPLPDLDGRITCLSCGRGGKARARTEPEPSSTTTGSTGTAGSGGSNPFTTWTAGTGDMADIPKVASRAARRGVSGCAVSFLVVVALVGAAVLAVSRTVRDAVDDVSSGFRSSNALSLSSTELTAIEGGAEVISVAYDGPSNTRFLARVGLLPQGSEPEAEWKSEPLPAGVYGGPVAVLDDTVFAALGNELWALDLATGEARWKAGLPDVVHTSCDCFAVVGESLVVQTADAQVFGYGVDSAEPRWGHRLESPSGRFMPSDAGLVVVDDSAENAGDREVRVLDLTNGTVIGRAVPTCTDDSGWEREMLFTDEVHVVPGGADLVATLSFGGGCAVRWNSLTGQVIWSVETGDISSSPSERGLLLGDRLVVPAGGGLVSIDLATGGATQLVAPDDLSLRPQERVGDLLVAQSSTNRGTTRYGLVGFDLATGQVRWQQQLPGGGELVEVGDGTDSLFEGNRISALLPFDDGLRVITFEPRGQIAAMTLSKVDPTTGELGEVVGLEVDIGSGIASVGVLAADGDGAIVSIGGDLIHVGDDGRRGGYP